MYPYRIIIKDCLQLNGMAKSNSICTSFSIERDLLNETTSTFTLNSKIPDNTKYGDVVILIDSFGIVIYQGVIIRYEENKLECNQIVSLFSDQWLYCIPNKVTIEESIEDIILNDFKQNQDTIMQAKYNFVICRGSNTNVVLQEKSENHTENFSSYIYDLYDKYFLQLFFDIPYSTGVSSIEIAKKEYTEFQIGDNVNSIRNFEVTEESVETNKLIIYSKEKELRGIYYATLNGITTDSNDPYRLQTIKTKYVFSDDEIETLIANNLNEQMYNHKISFDLYLKNRIYDFNSFSLGQPLKIYYKGKEYQTILTGYKLQKDSNEELKIVTMICGKVRTDLSKKIVSIINEKLESEMKSKID